MHKDWLFLLNLHKTNLYFILVKELLYSDGNMLFLKKSGKHFSVEDIRRNSWYVRGTVPAGKFDECSSAMCSSCSTSCRVSVAQIPIRKHRLPHILCPAWSIQQQWNGCWGMLPAGTQSQSGPAPMARSGGVSSVRAALSHVPIFRYVSHTPALARQSCGPGQHMHPEHGRAERAHTPRQTHTSARPSPTAAPTRAHAHAGHQPSC